MPLPCIATRLQDSSGALLATGSRLLAATLLVRRHKFLTGDGAEIHRMGDDSQVVGSLAFCHRLPKVAELVLSGQRLHKLEHRTAPGRQWQGSGVEWELCLCAMPMHTNVQPRMPMLTS